MSAVNLHKVITSAGQQLAHNGIAKSFALTIKKTTSAFFKLILNVSLFPTRYLSSKSFNVGTGYTRNLIPISPQKTKEYLRFAGGSVASFANDESWVKPFGTQFLNIEDVDLTGLPGNLRAEKKCFFDPENGLKMVIVHSDAEALIIYGSLRAGNAMLDDAEAQKLVDRQNIILGANLFGFKPAIFEQADALFQRVKSHPRLRGKRILFSGQCMGGCIASYVALKNQERAICFNTFPLGAGLQEDLGKNRLRQAGRLVTHISAKTDFVSDPKYLDLVDLIISSIGIRTPGNFGRRFSIPSAYNRAHDTHSYIFGSLMKHIGHNVRTRPAELRSWDIVTSNEDGRI